MDSIAKEADVSKATVYSYYGDKASLFADVMARMCEEMGGPLPVDGLAGAPPEEPELGRKFWETGPGRLEGVLTRYLEDANRRGLLEVDDPARLAARLFGQLSGLYVLPMLAGIRKRPSEAEIRRDVDDVVAEFVASRRRRS